MADGVEAGTPAPLPTEASPSAEYTAQMTGVQLTEPTLASLPDTSGRPAHIPEKFWDANKREARWEDLAKAYGELEAKQSAGTPAAAAPVVDPAAPVVPPVVDPAAKDTAKVEAPAEPVFLAPMNALSEAYGTGEVTEDHIKAVEDAGIPRNFIDTYLAGVKALEQVGAQQVFTYAGGEDTFKAASAWASTNLTAEELASYNATCDQPATRQQSIEWLVGKFKAGNPAEGTLVEGGVSTTSGDVYASDAERQVAFSDPRYRTDPAFRQSVAEKLLRSQRAGTITVNSEFHRRGR